VPVQEQQQAHIPASPPQTPSFQHIQPAPAREKLFNIQVGAFSSVESADRVFRQLRGNGFEAAQVIADNLYHVLAVGIPDSRLEYAAKRLSALGFNDIIIRE
jgi:cell division septation protein DedD